MQLFVWGLAIVCLAVSHVRTAAIPSGVSLEQRDADFLSVRTRLTKDRSGRKGDPPNKYFHESTFNAHYDGRFADRPLQYEDRKQHLTALIHTYLSTMNDIGAETWLMHGSLLGWWWNRKILPWDSDLDVMISEKSMYHLANYYNMTIHHYKLPGITNGRDYMLEINPNCRNSSTNDTLNRIDARWVDMDSGLFIDITTLRRNETAERLGMSNHMMVKDSHRYLFEEIFPLRDSLFEGSPVKIPYAYSDLLIEEYGPEALTARDFEKHHFDQDRMEWIPNRNPNYIPTRKPGFRPVGFPGRGKPFPNNSSTKTTAAANKVQG